MTFKCVAIKTALILFTVYFIGDTSLYAMDVNLKWNSNNDPSVLGYKVYYSKSSLAFPFNGTDAVQGLSPVEVGKATSLHLSELSPTSTYYFAVTACNSAGESSTSDIIGINPSGDVNGDGILDIKDPLYALQISLRKEYYTSANVAQGDVAPVINGVSTTDGIIDAGDVLVLLRKVVGEIP